MAPAFVAPGIPRSSFLAATSLIPRVSRPPRSGARALRAAQAAVRTDGAPKGKPTALTASKPASPKKKAKSSPLGKVVVMGLSHHTATVDVRERLAVPEAEWQLAAEKLCECSAVSEAAILSTCNRFEVYIVADHPFMAIQEVVAHLSSRSGLSVTELRKHLFMLTEDEASWHLMRVSAGLDSLVIGEGQILSQVKKWYELASDAEGHAGKLLQRLLNTAVSAGKRVRSETGIAKGAVSISSAAVELAEMKAIPDLDLPLREAKVCILGAGIRKLGKHLAELLKLEDPDPRNLTYVKGVRHTSHSFDLVCGWFKTKE